MLARYQAKASYPSSCGRTNYALLPMRYCKHIVPVLGWVEFVYLQTFLYSFDSATVSFLTRKDANGVEAMYVMKLIAVMLLLCNSGGATSEK